MQNPLFLTLRDTCLQCLQSPDVPALRRLSGLIAEADPPVLSPIQKYILFPLQQILSRCVSEPDA